MNDMGGLGTGADQKELKKIYCITGLGADYRLFQNIAIPGYSLVHLPWLAVADTDDMASYAMKLAASIKEANPVILGLSLGGMLATEIAKQIPGATVFIISSAKCRAELGFKSPFLKWLNKSGIIPDFMFNRTFAVQLHVLGAEAAADKALLRQVIADSDPVFVRKAIGLILNWNGVGFPSNIVHIHGTADRLITPDNVKPDYWIDGGSHIMILNRAPEINKIIAAHLYQHPAEI
jgi:pimeloyl-ACP methyl ester carboxylesterase